GGSPPSPRRGREKSGATGSQRKGAAHMAFNPFHGFRKHSRVLFAILTIICMITFVLSFGRGDFFEWVAGLVGAGKKGDVYTELYGKKVYEADLRDRQNDRRLSTEFFQMARAEGQRIAGTKAKKDLDQYG